jgi:TonB-linked SusC/RagA family outer membrane protein
MLFAPARAVLAAALLLIPALASAQEVRGTVTDASSGEPIPGTTVRVLASSIGTTTDFDGQYEIALPPGQRTLVFSFVGYRTQEIQVPEGERTVNVRLEEDLLGLDEVVVTGLGSSVSRDNLANAVETISARELAEVTTLQTLDNALNGKITGAVVNSNSGAPGGGINIRLRGITTINGASQPLYVVDGVIVSNDAVSSGVNAVTAAASGGNASNQDNPANRIADLVPEDIESLEILKGPSAAAIYGARAANGVVVIRTKRGARGRTDVNFSQTVGVTTLSNGIGSRQFTREQAVEAYGASAGALYDAAEANGFYDYEEALYGNNGLLLTSNLSISGGNDQTKFYVSGQAKNDEGIVEGTGYDKQSARVNITHRLSRIFEVDASTNYVRSVARRGLTGNDNSQTTFGVGVVNTPNFVNLFPDENGVYPDNPYIRGNFLQTRDLADISETNNRFLASGRLTANVFTTENQSVQLIAIGGADYYALEQESYFPVELQFEPLDGLPGTSVLGRTTNLNTNLQALAAHAYSLENAGLTFSTQAGFTVFDQDFNNAVDVAQGLIAGQSNLDQAVSANPQQNRLFQNDRALFVQEEINYRDAIIGTFGVRAERSSANGDVDQYYAYPKAGLSVNVNNLMGGGNVGPFELIKPRVAFGQTGNTAAFGSKFTTYPGSNVGGQIGVAVGGLRGNPDIEPERASEIEGGVDFTMFDGRVNLEATGYYKFVDNLILQRQLPPSTGFGAEIINGGELENRGIELGLSLIPVQTDAVQWISRTSFWTNEAEVTSLDVPPFQASGGGFGNSLGSIRIEEGKSPTQIVGVDGAAGVVALGDVAPDFQMSFFNDVKIMDRLRFTAFLHWKKGGDVINLTQLLADFAQNSEDYDDDPQPVTNPNTGETEIRTLGQRRVDGFGSTARPFVQDASYLRLREIGLYYDVPLSFAGSLASTVRTFRIGVSANNLLTITPYESYDPEVSNFGNQPVASGVEVTPFPASRSFLFHVNLGF